MFSPFADGTGVASPDSRPAPRGRKLWRQGRGSGGGPIGLPLVLPTPPYSVAGRRVGFPSRLLSGPRLGLVRLSDPSLQRRRQRLRWWPYVGREGLRLAAVGHGYSLRYGVGTVDPTL